MLVICAACTHSQVRAPVHTAPFASAVDRLLGEYHARGDFDGVVAIAKLGLTSWGVAAQHPPITVRSYRTDGARSPDVELAAFGPAGAIYGDATDLSVFSQALLDHRLLDAASMTIMATGDPQLGMEALGSWGYELPVPGHTTPVALVERQGNIYGTRILALASPSDDFTISILATNERADLFNLWTRKGLPFELVTLVAR